MVQSPRRRLSALPAFGLLLMLSALPLRAGDLPEPRQKRFAVEVGAARIPLAQILEVWGPAWYDNVARAARGDLSAEACNAALQTEWTEALETVIREEVFYQEAEREAENMLKEHARRIYQQQSGRSGGGAAAHASLERIERDLRERMRKSIDRQLTDFVDRHIRAAGGLEQLKRVLEGRELSWSEWRERIRKKAFADQHIAAVVGPRVPKHPRPSAIREYYRDHKEDFTTPGRVVFRHILFSFTARGGEEAARIAAGNVYDAIDEKRVTFEEAAKQFSDDKPSRARGGLETEVSPDDSREAWLGELRAAVRSQTPGEVGPILLSTAGAHLVQLVQADPGTPMPFREAQREIGKRLYASQWEEEVSRFYADLKQQVRIRILMPRVPANYRFDPDGPLPTLRPSRHVGPGARPDELFPDAAEDQR